MTSPTSRRFNGLTMTEMGFKSAPMLPCSRSSARWLSTEFLAGEAKLMVAIPP
jgi:hypothetical protein